jgi:G3E family GTPase
MAGYSTDEDKDTLLAELLRKHPDGDGRWAEIEKEFNSLTGEAKGKQWLKNRSKKVSAKLAPPEAPPKDNAAKESADHSSHSHGGSAAFNKGSQDRLPVLVLTGYLGAGKTTLLNYILKEQSQLKLAVIENEIGEVSIDDALVEQKHEDLAEELVLLDNGCVCCTIRGDLVKTLYDIAEKHRSGKLRLDGVLIELTGAADPAPVVQSFMVDDKCRQAYRIDNVIALVDAKHGLAKLDEQGGSNTGTACAQIAFSSTILLNKIDLVDTSALEALEKRIMEVNSCVKIIRCEHGRVDMTKLFDVGCFDLKAVLEEQYMDEEEFNKFYEPKMDTTISNVGVKSQGPINLHALQRFLDKYLDLEETAKDFLRVKGFFEIAGNDKVFVMQCVHMLRNQNFTRAWGAKETRENRIIFIGRNMQQRREELTEGFLACAAKPLRFPVGSTALARVESGYERVTILKHWDEMNAYRLRIKKDGDEVWAPIDDDVFIKAC